MPAPHRSAQQHECRESVHGRSLRSERGLTSEQSPFTSLPRASSAPSAIARSLAILPRAICDGSGALSHVFERDPALHSCARESGPARHLLPTPTTSLGRDERRFQRSIRVVRCRGAGKSSTRSGEVELSRARRKPRASGREESHLRRPVTRSLRARRSQRRNASPTSSCACLAAVRTRNQRGPLTTRVRERHSGLRSNPVTHGSLHAAPTAVPLWRSCRRGSRLDTGISGLGPPPPSASIPAVGLLPGPRKRRGPWRGRVVAGGWVVEGLA